MFTDPKSGDYLAWFFCTREQTRGQMAYFSRHGCRNDNHISSSQVETNETPNDFESVSSYPPADNTDHWVHKKDIVDLIKRARARTDRTLALLQRNRGQEAIDSDHGRNPLETFVGGFAHHFNNLFMTIQCNVSLIMATRAGEHRHQRRLKRIEKLVMSESMLTNDLLGIVIEKGCYIDERLQAHLLDEIVGIADTIMMRQAFCSWDDSRSADKELPRTALKRLSSGLAGILHRLLNEIHEHTAFVIADNSADVVENVRLHKILQTVVRGRKLLHDLTGNTPAATTDGEQVDLNTMTEIVMATCLNCRDNVQCHLDIDSDMINVKIGSRQVAAIMRKLYDNAVAAMPKGGDLFLTIKNYCPDSNDRADDYVRLTFRDTGLGMAPEVVARVFDPFFVGIPCRGDKGLGLTAVEGLLNVIGGHISIDSTPGKGTEVTVDLPAAAADGVSWKSEYNERYTQVQLIA